MTKTMLICSTKQQVVNLVPALTEKVDEIIIFTTTYAKKEDWTSNLLPVLKKRKINCSEVLVTNEIEQNVLSFSELIKSEIEKVRDSEIFLNVGGGQKTFTMAMMKAYADLPDANTKVVYTEANKRCLYFISKEMKTTSKSYQINLDLKEILGLNGYSLFEGSKTKNPNLNATESFSNEFYQKHFPAAKTGDYFRKDSLFKEIFYRCIMNEGNEPVEKNDIEKSIKARLLGIKPHIDDLPVSYPLGHSPHEIKVKIKQLRESPQKSGSAIKLLESVYADFRYNSFWNTVKKEIVSYVENELRISNVKIRNEAYSVKEQNKLKDIFKDISGSSMISFDEKGFLRHKDILFSSKYGDLFEEMVFIEVLKLQEDVVWDNVHQIWLNVFTKKTGANVKTPEAEYDLVIVTKFGTLILIESKSAKFDNKVAKGQERDVQKKSGPYGKAVIAGPLLGEIKSIKDSKEREKEYPYVSFALFAQAQKVEDAGMQYWCLDKISENLKKLLSRRSSASLQC